MRLICCYWLYWAFLTFQWENKCNTAPENLIWALSGGCFFWFVPVLQYNRHNETFVFKSKLRQLLPHCFLPLRNKHKTDMDEETHSDPARDRIKECEILVPILLFSTDYVTNTKENLSITHNKPTKLGRFLWHIWEATCCHRDFAPPSNWHCWEGRKKDLEIQTEIRDHLQEDLIKTFSLGRTNIIVFHEGAGGKGRKDNKKIEVKQKLIGSFWNSSGNTKCRSALRSLLKIYL